MMTAEELRMKTNAKYIGQLQQLQRLHKLAENEDTLCCEVIDEDGHWCIVLSDKEMKCSDINEPEYEAMSYDDCIEAYNTDFLKSVVRRAEVLCARKYMPKLTDEQISDFLDKCDEQFNCDIEANCEIAARLKELYVQHGKMACEFMHHDMKCEVWLEEFIIRVFFGGYEMYTSTYTDLERADDTDFLRLMLEGFEKQATIKGERHEENQRNH